MPCHRQLYVSICVQNICPKDGPAKSRFRRPVVAGAWSPLLSRVVLLGGQPVAARGDGLLAALGDLTGRAVADEVLVQTGRLAFHHVQQQLRALQYLRA